jgi:hypothetical protein
MNPQEELPCCLPCDPVGLPPCVCDRKGSLTSKQWESLCEDEAEARASRERAGEIIGRNVFNRVFRPDDFTVPPEFQSKPYGNFLARGPWLMMKMIPGRDLTWAKGVNGTSSPGERALQAIEQAMRNDDWEFVKRFAELQMGITSRGRNKPDVTDCGEPRDLLVARNWVRFRDVDQDLPGLAWFKKAAANGGSDLDLVNALMRRNGIAPFSNRSRLNKRLLELKLRPIRSFSLTRLPTATWATQILHRMK